MMFLFIFNPLNDSFDLKDGFFSYNVLQAFSTFEKKTQSIMRNLANLAFKTVSTNVEGDSLRLSVLVIAIESIVARYDHLEFYDWYRKNISVKRRKS